MDDECWGYALNEPDFFAPADHPARLAGHISGEENAVVGGVTGRKDDTGKLDPTLLFDDMPLALTAVIEVLQWAITKKQPEPYARGSWQDVEPFQPRYRAAQLRHMLDSARVSRLLQIPPHQVRDAETGLLHLAHIATDALFQLEMACRELEKPHGI